MDRIYETEVINSGGTKGTSYIKGGQSFEVSSPLDEGREGLNPEQFMGLAWATCLNATLISLLKGRNLDHLDSKVRVVVSMFKEPLISGYYFSMQAFISIESFDLDRSQAMALLAHRFCPVSKLISANPHVSIEVEEF